MRLSALVLGLVPTQEKVVQKRLSLVDQSVANYVSKIELVINIANWSLQRKTFPSQTFVVQCTTLPGSMLSLSMDLVSTFQLCRLRKSRKANLK